MSIRYVRAPDIEARVLHIARALGLRHIDGRVVCMRAVGSRARWTLARCHALPRVMQAALGAPPCYVIEVIPGEFDGLDDEEKTRTLIHELLHIPKSFGGGLKGHRHVNRARVMRLYRRLREVEAAGGAPAE